MLKLNHEDFATGITTYYEQEPTRNSPQTSTYLKIVLPGALPISVFALVDTGSPWVILNSEINEQLGFHAQSTDIKLKTRLGTMTGCIERHSITLPAEKGSALEVDATLFVCNEWKFGNILGYNGFLQRIRFAFDPKFRKFYFGSY